MRDPANDTAELWGVVRQGLADARLLTRPLNSDNELWRKAEHLVESSTRKVGHGGANLGSGASASENHSGAGRIRWCSILSSSLGIYHLSL